jgi:hypothetical protein
LANEPEVVPKVITSKNRHEAVLQQGVDRAGQPYLANHVQRTELPDGGAGDAKAHDARRGLLEIGRHFDRAPVPGDDLPLVGPLAWE